MVENPFYNEITQVGGCWGLPENLFIYSFSSACPVPTKQRAPSPGMFHKCGTRAGRGAQALSLPAPSSPLHCAVRPLSHLTKGKLHCESLEGPARGVLGKQSRERGERNKEAGEERRGAKETEKMLRAMRAGVAR